MVVLETGFALVFVGAALVFLAPPAVALFERYCDLFKRK